jgi:hypothetical protein
VFGIEQDVDIIGKEKTIPTEAATKAFNTGEGPGPDEISPMLDMWFAYNSPWNCQVWEFLLKRAKLVKAKAAYTQLRPISDDLWLHIISERCRSLQSKYRLTVPRRKGDGRQETQAKAVQRYLEKEAQVQKSARQRTRRYTVRELSLFNITIADYR